MSSSKLDFCLGVLALLFCGILLFVWIPLDVDTGIVEKVRRQIRLGDAFAPTIAAIMIGLGGVLLLTKRVVDRSTRTDRLIQARDFKHAIVVMLLCSIAVVLMRYAGPLVLRYVEGQTAEYRLLRDTVPWKYIGFVVGGMFMVVALIAYIEKRIRLTHFIVALLIVALLIGFYDLPFDDLLLPPNGDV